MKKEDPICLEISSEYIHILKKEGNKASIACMNLNADKVFSNAVTAAVNPDFTSFIYKAEHILLRDLIAVFNSFAGLYNDQKEIPVRAKFILVFLYERLLGKDLSEAYDLVKMNAITLSERFDKNIKLIRETSFFQPVDEMKNFFILPAILKKINSEQFAAISSFITHIATLIVKADDLVSEEEKELLKQITTKVNNPKITIDKARYNEVPDDDTLEIVLNELHELIGLESIKENVKHLSNFLKVQKLRVEQGLKTSNNSLHAVFMGPPGTGKTTVARMLGRIYKHLGYLEKGHLVETDRAGMVAGYVGQTAIKTDEIIKSALGGILFIDEAYSLTGNSLNDFGREAIEILLKRMEDERSNFVVVVAGYPNLMEEFIRSNPGLQSRFNRYFEFDHYGVEALLKIFKLYVTKGDFFLTEDAEEKLREILERVYEKRHKAFGNARTMRNLFEKIIELQANRIVAITPVTADLLKTLTEEDIPEVLKTVKEIVLFDEDE